MQLVTIPLTNDQLSDIKNGAEELILEDSQIDTIIDKSGLLNDAIENADNQGYERGWNDARDEFDLSNDPQTLLNTLLASDITMESLAMLIKTAIIDNGSYPDFERFLEALEGLK
jgi:hypothetical protein